jgi:hypothetical protein
MKSLKSSWKVGLGILAGFLLGVIFSHVPLVKAQTQGGRYTSIYKLDMHKGRALLGNVVGFSCVPSSGLDSDGDAVCYIVSQ